MRWPWSHRGFSAREIAEAQDMRLRNARAGAVYQDRLRILRGLERLVRPAEEGADPVVSAAAVRSLIEAK